MSSTTTGTSFTGISSTVGPNIGSTIFNYEATDAAEIEKLKRERIIQVQNEVTNYMTKKLIEHAIKSKQQKLAIAV